MNNVVVRAAGESDVTAVSSLVQCYWEFEHIPGFENDAVSGQIRLLLNHTAPASVLVAEGNTAIVGYLLLVYVFSLEHLGLTAEIDELYVKPDYRSRGVGAALLKAAESAAAGTGCTNISLQIGRDNERGRAFYQRRGYSRRGGYSLMEKDLKAC